MDGSAPRRCTLLLGLLCLLEGAVGIAAAAPAGTGRTHRAGGAHAVACHTRARAPTGRRRSHCHAAQRRRKPTAKTPAGAAPPRSEGAGGTADGRSGSSSTPPVAVAPGAPPASAPPAGAPPSVPHIQVVAVEYGLTLSRTSVPAGKVILELVNHGQDEHNLNASAGEGPLATSLPNTLAGGVRDQAVELRAGSYTLFCSLPEHEQKGMRATLLVQ